MAARAQDSKYNHTRRSTSISKVDLAQSSPWSAGQTGTPSGTPMKFYGMLTRSSLLDSSFTETLSGSTTSIQKSFGPDTALDVYVDQTKTTITKDEALCLALRAEEKAARLKQENDQLRDHIAILSDALHRSMELFDERESMLRERDQFITTLSARILIDRQCQRA